MGILYMGLNYSLMCSIYISFHRYYGLKVKGINLFLRTMSGFQSLATYDVNTPQTGAQSDRDPSIPLNRGVDELPWKRPALLELTLLCMHADCYCV